MEKPNIGQMTLREKIGQMFIMRDDRLHNLVPNCELREYLKKNPIGGIWATGRLQNVAEHLNFEAAEGGEGLADLKEYVDILNSNSLIPLLIGGDAEKGSFMGSVPVAGPDAVAATDDMDIAYRYAACVSRELKLGGFNWRWSPISDLANHRSSISVNRVCSDNPKTVADVSIAQIKGMQDNGIAATVKHFPGGDLNELRDSHFSTSVNNASLEDWKKTQGEVYRRSIESGAYSVMMGHHIFPAVDDSKIGNKRRPASFSKKIITEFLKGEMGFKGVVVTDDIAMRSAFSIFGREQWDKTYIELVKAGNDMILGTTVGCLGEDYIGAIEKAVLSGEIPEERIDDACTRILDMKQKLGLFNKQKPDYSLEQARRATEEMNVTLAEVSLTLLENRKKLLPLNKEKVKKVAIVALTHSEVFPKKLEFMEKALTKRGIEVFLENGIRGGKNVATLAEEYDLIIYANFLSAHQPMGYCGFYGAIAEQFFSVLTYGAEKSVVVSFGSPFLKSEYYEEADTYINAYWYNKETQEAFVRAIFGEIPFKGKSPFEL